jgi:hypothetical protein
VVDEGIPGGGRGKCIEKGEGKGKGKVKGQESFKTALRLRKLRSVESLAKLRS